MADLQELIAAVDQLSAEDFRKLYAHVRERVDSDKVVGYAFSPELLAELDEAMRPIQEEAAQMSEEEVFAALDDVLTKVRGERENSRSY